MAPTVGILVVEDDDLYFDFLGRFSPGAHTVVLAEDPGEARARCQAQRVCLMVIRLEQLAAYAELLGELRAAGTPILALGAREAAGDLPTEVDLLVPRSDLEQIVAAAETLLGSEASGGEDRPATTSPVAPASSPTAGAATPHEVRAQSEDRANRADDGAGVAGANRSQGQTRRGHRPTGSYLESLRSETEDLHFPAPAPRRAAPGRGIEPRMQDLRRELTEQIQQLRHDLAEELRQFAGVQTGDASASCDDAHGEDLRQRVATLEARLGKDALHLEQCLGQLEMQLTLIESQLESGGSPRAPGSGAAARDHGAETSRVSQLERALALERQQREMLETQLATLASRIAAIEHPLLGDTPRRRFGASSSEVPTLVSRLNGALSAPAADEDDSGEPGRPARGPAPLSSEVPTAAVPELDLDDPAEAAGPGDENEPTAVETVPQLFLPIETADAPDDPDSQEEPELGEEPSSALRPRVRRDPQTPPLGSASLSPLASPLRSPSTATTPAAQVADVSPPVTHPPRDPLLDGEIDGRPVFTVRVGVDTAEAPALRAPRWIFVAAGGALLLLLVGVLVLVLLDCDPSGQPEPSAAADAAQQQDDDSRRSASYPPSTGRPSGDGARPPDAAVVMVDAADGGPTGAVDLAAADVLSPRELAQRRAAARRERHAGLLRAAGQQIARGQQADARELLTKALQIKDDLRVRVLLADSHESAGEHWAAIHHLNKAVGMAPDEASTALLHDRTGRLLLKVNKPARACVAFRRALAADPGLASARTHIDQHCS